MAFFMEKKINLKIKTINFLFSTYYPYMKTGSFVIYYNNEKKLRSYFDCFSNKNKNKNKIELFENGVIIR